MTLLPSALVLADWKIGAVIFTPPPEVLDGI